VADRHDARAAGYRRRAVLVGTGKHIRDVAHALGDGQHPIEVVASCLRAHCPPTACAPGTLGDLEEISAPNGLTR